MKPHGNTGNKNAEKEVKADSHVQLRVLTEHKNKMISIAQKEGKNLTEFILSRCLTE